MNILQASLFAMKTAAENLDIRPDHIFVDGNKNLVDMVANKCDGADGDTHRDEDCPSFHEEDDIGSDDYNTATAKSPKEFCEMPEDSEHSYESLKG